MARLIDADAIMTEIANIRLSDPIADSTRNLIISILGLAPTVEEKQITDNNSRR